MRRAFLASLCCCLGLLSACYRQPTASQPTAFSFFTSETAHHIQRVAVLPLYRHQRVGESAQSLDLAMSSSLREIGLYEILSTSSATRDRLTGTAWHGISSLDIEHLRLARQELRADAILIGYVDFYDCYDPIAAGLELHLIDCRSGETAWSVTAHFDGKRHDVQQDIKGWYRDTIGQGQENSGGWQRALQAPSLFSRYVSDRLVESVLWTSGDPHHPLPHSPHL